MKAMSPEKAADFVLATIDLAAAIFIVVCICLWAGIGSGSI